MPEAERQDRFRYLYRQTEGVIDRATWTRASVGPLGIACVLTVIAWFVAPNQPRDLGSQAFFSVGMVLAHAYLILYGFAVFVCAVAEYFISAKRFRDRGRSPELAGLAPSRCSSRAQPIGSSRAPKARCPNGRRRRSTSWRWRSSSGRSPNSRSDPSERRNRKLPHIQHIVRSFSVKMSCQTSPSARY